MPAASFLVAVVLSLLGLLPTASRRCSRRNTRCRSLAITIRHLHRVRLADSVLHTKPGLAQTLPKVWLGVLGIKGMRGGGGAVRWHAWITTATIKMNRLRSALGPQEARVAPVRAPKRGSWKAFQGWGEVGIRHGVLVGMVVQHVGAVERKRGLLSRHVEAVLVLQLLVLLVLLLQLLQLMLVLLLEHLETRNGVWTAAQANLGKGQSNGDACTSEGIRKEPGQTAVSVGEKMIRCRTQRKQNRRLVRV